VGVVDTNADPDLIDFPIAANDDAIRSIKVIVSQLTEAMYEAKSGLTQEMIEATVDKERTAEPSIYTSEEPASEESGTKTPGGPDTKETK
jgi:small subunit ribosomal protein S2